MKSIFKIILTSCLLLTTSYLATAQVGINTDGSDPDASAILDVSSTDKGVLIPRLTTTQRTAISNPATGLLVFDSTTESFWFRASAAWIELITVDTNTQLSEAEVDDFVSNNGYITSADDADADPTNEIELPSGGTDGQVLKTDGNGTVNWTDISLENLSDADNDTKIQVEESSDEDIIRFDLGGTEFMRLDSGRMEIVNTGNSIFLGEGAGENDIYDQGNNVYLGSFAGHSNLARFNLFAGVSAGYFNTSGYQNNFIGYQAGYSNTSGYQNNFIGGYTGYNNTTGSFNTFIGAQAGQHNTTGQSNSFFGTTSGVLNTTGYSNTFMGYGAGLLNTGGDENTFVGVAAGNKNTTGNNNVFMGYGAGDGNTTGNRNIAIGNLAGVSNSEGSENIFIGNRAGYYETSDDKLYIENSDSSLPLIFGDFDADSLQINGKLNINGVYNFPTADGNVNQTLTTDGSGTLTWTDITNTGAQTLSFASDTLTISDGNSVDLSSLKHLDDNGLVLNLEEDEIVLDLSIEDELGTSLGSPLWQSFTPNYSGYLYQLSVKFENSISDFSEFTFDGGKISIYEGEGIAGNLLAEMELDSKGTGWKTFNFSADSISLTSGNLYTFSIEDTADNSFELASNSSNPYADGRSSNSETEDLLFIMYNTISVTFEDNIIDINPNDITDAGINLSYIDTLHFNDGSSITTGIPSILQDIDGNTKIQVEERNDEDIIRFDLGGTEYMSLDKGRIEIFNTGSSVFIGEGAGANDDLTNANVFLGSNAGNSNTEGYNSVAIGGTAYRNATTAYENVAIGYAAAGNMISGTKNVSIGFAALENNETGGGNTVLGYYAGKGDSLHNKSENVLIGYTAGVNLQADANTMLGYGAGYNTTSGTNNVFLGYKAGYNANSSNKLYIESSNADSTAALIYGDFDADFLQINGALNINGAYSMPTTDGTASQILTTNGSGSLSWANLSLGVNLSDTDGNTKIQVEESSDEDIIRFDLGGTEFMRLDSGRIEIMNTNNSILIGEGAGQNSDYSNATDNVFVGYQSGYNNDTGSGNVFLGSYVGLNNTSGLNNAFTGSYSGGANTTGSYNIFTGPQAGYSNTTGSYNIFMGLQAGYSNVSGEKNIFLGFKAGYNDTTSNKLYIANSDTSSPLIYGEFDNDLLQINGKLNINGTYNFPTTDGNTSQLLTTDGNGTLSWSSLNNLSDADGDTKIQVEESDNENIIRFDLGGTEFMKLDSGRIEITNTGSSVFIGQNAGENDDYSDNRNVFLGFNAGRYNTSGNWNVFSGYEAGETNTTGKQNVFTGFRAGYSNTTGENNTFTGYNAGYSTTTGVENLILGDNAGYSNQTGSNNIYLGYQSGHNNQTGSNNVYIGSQTGYYATGSNELYIDNSNTTTPLIYGDFSNDVVEFNGNVGVGTTPTNGKLEIDGYIDNVINNYTYVSNVAASVQFVSSNSTDKEVSIYASDRIVGKFVISLSDERIKDIKGISNSKKDLAILNQIQITDYEFKDKVREGNTQQKKVIAQQVAKVFPQAVEKQTTEVIPDIYQTAEMNENGWITLHEELGIDDKELKIGDKVQIFFKQEKKFLEVLEIKEDKFRVKSSAVYHQPSTVFVYGRQVHDFHTVDYQAISMLNVSATQELYQIILGQKEEIKQLKQQTTSYQNTLNALLERVGKLEDNQQGNVQRITN